MGKKIMYAVAAPLVAVVVALVISSIVLLFAGANPLSAYNNMWEFGSRLDRLFGHIAVGVLGAGCSRRFGRNRVRFCDKYFRSALCNR